MESDSNNTGVLRQPSETAMATAFLRALSAHDERNEGRGPDYLAEIFLPDNRRGVLRDAKAREWVLRNEVDLGLYALLVARTAFFDEIVANRLASQIPQIVFLGAGYDTRPYRLSGVNRGTRIFEVDARLTQDRKRELLKLFSVSIPAEIAYVAVNFETGELSDALSANGFDTTQQTLFVWEGVTYYLTPTAVDETLNHIRTNSPAGSPICFDFASVPVGAPTDPEAARRHARMRARYRGEPTKFRIAESGVGIFLRERGFSLVEDLNAKDMEQKYLKLGNGSSIGVVPSVFHIAHAMVSS